MKADTVPEPSAEEVVAGLAEALLSTNGTDEAVCEVIRSALLLNAEALKRPYDITVLVTALLDEVCRATGSTRYTCFRTDDTWDGMEITFLNSGVKLEIKLKERA